MENKPRVTRQRKIYVAKNKKERYKERKRQEKSTKISRSRQFRSERRYKTDSAFSFIGILISIILVVVLLRTLVDKTGDYQFSIFYFIEQLAQMPQISIVEVLSWNLGFPSWLEWAEQLIVIISFVGACLINLIMVLTWFLKFLFIG